MRPDQVVVGGFVCGIVRLKSVASLRLGCASCEGTLAKRLCLERARLLASHYCTFVPCILRHLSTTTISAHILQRKINSLRIITNSYGFFFFFLSFLLYWLRLLGFLVFLISFFFEKSLILCFVRIVFLLLWLFLFGSSVFSFWSP